eukprot:1180456-Pyramimonas_sp.AAC.1
MAAVGRDRLSAPESSPQLKRPRRELVDDIDPYVSVSVMLAGGSTRSCKVLSSAKERDILAIEMTESSLEILREVPAGDSDVVASSVVVKQEHVRWLPCKRALRVRYCANGVWKQKSAQVPKTTIKFQ